jgi:hypothetical protein
MIGRKPGTTYLQEKRSGIVPALIFTGVLARGTSPTLHKITFARFFRANMMRKEVMDPMVSSESLAAAIQASANKKVQAY